MIHEEIDFLNDKIKQKEKFIEECKELGYKPNYYEYSVNEIEHFENIIKILEATNEVYYKGKRDRENELKKGFKYILGSEYSWQEVLDTSNRIVKEEDEDEEVQD